ncbi:flagellin C [mine drainage metagenome]|uniref:Flagellin C n=1 Tax=mine drainage metagenome TaxID=410659 RepID=A0A1J5QN06_9ZZZZ
MGLRINQNIAAMNAYRNLSITDGQMAKSLERLSSGFRINRAADDAAGLSISEGLRSQIGGLKVAVRNAQDGISVVQTAEGALSEVHSILQRMRDLAVQASNTGSQDVTARTAAQTELTQLNFELDRIGATTRFGQQALLNGVGASVSATAAPVAGVLTTPASGAFAISGTWKNSTTGANVALTGAAVTLGTATSYSSAASYQSAIQSALDTTMTANGIAAGSVTATVTGNSATSWTVALSTSSLTANLTGTTGFSTTAGTALGVTTQSSGLQQSSFGTTFQIGANSGEQVGVAFGAVSSTVLGTNSLDLVNSASAAITTIDSAISSISTERATLGAFQNRFEHTINNLNVTVENLSASESRIRDTDMAAEMVNFTRSQILSQAGTAMLAQANAQPQSVLKLLG